MRNNETGEFELVVGNRQLLSGFFIVVLLFAVAFAMGYVVGQNSPRAARQPETASAAPPVSLTPADSRPQPGAGMPAAPPPPTDLTPAAASGTAPDAAASPVTQPAQNTPVAAPSTQGSAGSYWQVMAVSQTDAETVARALK